MDKERFLASGLLEQYVLGLTSAEESAEVERYADAFPEIKAEIEALQQAMEQYAAQHAIPPPDGLKKKIMSEIGGQQSGVTKSTSERSKTTPANRNSLKWPFLLTLFAALMMALLAGNLYFQKKAVEHQLSETATAYSALKKACEAQQAQQAEMEKVYAVLKHPQTKTITLQGSSLAPEATAVAYWNESTKAGYVNLLNLPSPPAGKQYQIWADIDHKMVSMGLLSAENGTFQAIDFGENATSLNITLEPEGGSKTPNVDLLYVNGPV